MNSMTRPNRREGAVIAGVAAAVAERLGMSRGLTRTLFVLLGLVGAGEVLYIALWILLPQRS